MTFSLASMIAAALVHCTADGTAPAAPADIDAADVAVSDDPGSDAGPDTPDSALEAALNDAGGCSPDHWCRVPLPSEDLDVSALWSFAPDDVLAVGPTGAIHWDGTSWSAVTAPDAGIEGLTSLWATGPNDIWGVAQNQRRIVHGSRTAPGAPFNWSQVEYTDGPTMNVIRGIGPKDLWVSGVQPTCFRCPSVHVLQHGVLPDGDTDSDAGADASAPAGMPSWTTVPIDTPPNFAFGGFGVTENNELWAAGWSEFAYVFHGTPLTPNGNDYIWEESMNAKESPYTYFVALWAPHANDIWAISVPGLNFHRGVQNDGGVAWNSAPNHSNVNMAAVWGTGKDDVWTVGAAGAIRHWDGTSWKVSQIAVDGFPIYNDLFAIHGTSTNDIWAVGKGIALHHGPGASP